MKKRDLFVLALLVILVIALTAWENINKHEEDKLVRQQRARERAELEKRLAGHGLIIDSLKTDVLQLIDSLRTETAAFESVAVARQKAMEQRLAEQTTPIEDVEPRAEEAAVRDTLPDIIRAEYERAMGALPDDLTHYEQKIATKEVENAITAKFGLSHQEFVEMKQQW